MATATTREQARLQKSIEDNGLVATARRLKVHYSALRSLAFGFNVQPGTLRKVREALAAQATEAGK
jgi:hypothetical protein